MVVDNTEIVRLILAVIVIQWLATGLYVAWLFYFVAKHLGKEGAGVILLLVSSFIVWPIWIGLAIRSGIKSKDRKEE